MQWVLGCESIKLCNGPIFPRPVQCAWCARRRESASSQIKSATQICCIGRKVLWILLDTPISVRVEYARMLRRKDLRPKVAAMLCWEN